jgi:hypothetical protein
MFMWFFYYIWLTYHDVCDLGSLKGRICLSLQGLDRWKTFREGRWSLGPLRLRLWRLNDFLNNLPKIPKYHPFGACCHHLGILVFVILNLNL